MKVEKTLAVLIAILPLVYLAVIALFLLTELDNALYTALSFLVLLGLILSICFAALTKGTNRKFLATANVWMLSTNAAVFLAEIIFCKQCQNLPFISFSLPISVCRTVGSSDAPTCGGR